MPIAPPTSPLFDLMYQGNNDVGDTISRDEMMEMQREQESRLLGTFFVQAIFLAMAIMLYATWEWSQFGKPWEAAMFYALLSFSLQAALYFTYRTMFEDSTNYRRELKRMKNKQKRRMAQMSFEVRKMQTENLLQQQMGQYKAQIEMANADGIITPQEQQMLDASRNLIQQTATESQFDPTYIDKLAKELGIDRFSVGPIPLGPKLTFSQSPTRRMHVQQPQQAQQAPKLDLEPTDKNSLEAKAQEQLA